MEWRMWAMMGVVVLLFLGRPAVLAEIRAASEASATATYQKGSPLALIQQGGSGYVPLPHGQLFEHGCVLNPDGTVCATIHVIDERLGLLAVDSNTPIARHYAFELNGDQTLFDVVPPDMATS